MKHINSSPADGTKIHADVKCDLVTKSFCETLPKYPIFKITQNHSSNVLFTSFAFAKWAQRCFLWMDIHPEVENSLMMLMCFPPFLPFSIHSSLYDWLTSLLIPSYHFTTSFWKKVHGVGLLENNIALLVLLLCIRGEFRSPGQPSAVSNLHRHSGKTTEESQKEKRLFPGPWQHTEGARYGSWELHSVAHHCYSPLLPLTLSVVFVKSIHSDSLLVPQRVNFFPERGTGYKSLTSHAGDLLNFIRHKVRGKSICKLLTRMIEMKQLCHHLCTFNSGHAHSKFFQFRLKFSWGKNLLLGFRLWVWTSLVILTILVAFSHQHH